jgi:hypothetical protein
MTSVSKSYHTQQIVHIYNILISEKIIFCRFLNASRGLFFPNLLTWRRIYVFPEKYGFLHGLVSVTYLLTFFFFLSILFEAHVSSEVSNREGKWIFNY